MNTETTAQGIEAEVCRDIAIRQQKGITKYGMQIIDNPLAFRAWLQHAYEESLDTAIYLKRAMQATDTDMQNAVQEILAKGKPATIDRVVEMVAAHFDKTAAELKMPTRREAITWPRHITMFILHVVMGYRTTEIGRYFKQDHGTVSNAHQGVKNRCDVEPKTKALVAELSKKAMALSQKEKL